MKRTPEVVRPWTVSTLVVVGGLLLLASATAGPERGRAGEPPSADVPDPRAEAYARHVRALRARLPDGGEGFTIVVQRPFVVVGDESPVVVRRRAVRVVKWAVDLLKKAYFEKDPAHILDVFLFKDAKSYRHHAKLLFDDEPTTPSGYYAAADRALVMNIATGGGTLVHEIVHPYVAANFPACPAWFNEGMGSLYEQCGEENGRIVGYTNWRLPILQRAIREDRLPSLRSLCSTTTIDFYTDGRATNYAQARYLCYYLQERKLLRRYYRAFVKHHERDPTGFATLQKVLGEEDMEAFEKRWRRFVLKLRYP